MLLRRMITILAVLGLLVAMLALPAAADGSYYGGLINCGGGGFPVTQTHQSVGANHFLAPNWVAGYKDGTYRTVFWTIYKTGNTEWSFYIIGGPITRRALTAQRSWLA